MRHDLTRTRSAAAALGLVTAVTATGLAGGTTHAVDTAVHIDAGGAGDSTFTADQFFVGGAVDTNRTGSNGNITFSRTVTNPIPQNEWNTDRFLESTYTVPGLSPASSYPVRLYFLDWSWTKVGQRVFDVAVNGNRVLQNFDIIKSAVDAGGDGSRIGVERDFTTTASPDGTVTINFVRGTADQPMVNAISIVPST
jgi:hypothetical protein